MEFEGGKTASFTMTAFNKHEPRKTVIFGTRGELSGDGRKIWHFDFLTDQRTEINTEAPADNPLRSHGGGDYFLMQSFVAAVANNDPSRVLSGPMETLESHQMVFAAEQARRRGKVMEVKV